MAKLRSLLLAVGLVWLGARTAHAQGSYGSISGSVVDQIGNPLKGVKVVATSETQIGGPKAVYTNDEGAFHFSALQPGTFQLRASAPKLNTWVGKNIPVGIGNAAEVNIVMDVEASTETVSVVEKPPTIVTTKSTVKETFDLEMVNNLPHGSRDDVFSQLVNDIAGGMKGRVRGGASGQTVYSQDGFEMTGQHPTLNSAAAFEVSSGGYGADNPMAAGGAVNVITRSGSNKFEFEFNGTADSNRLRFFTDQTDGEAPTYQYVLNPSISGPIIKDKLWYHLNTEAFLIQNGRQGDPTGMLPAPAVYQKFIQKGTLKLTWQVTARNKVQWLTNFDSPHERNMRNGLGIDPLAQQDRDAFRFFTGLIWESLLTDNLVFRSQVGLIAIPQVIYPTRCHNEPVDCDHIPSVVQTFPVRQDLNNNNNHERNDLTSIQFQNRLEWFANSKRWGDHSVVLKQHFYTEQDVRRSSKPGDVVTEWNGTVPSTQTTYFSNDPRVSDPRFGWAINSTGVSRHLLTLSDAWRPTRYLTITPGLSHVWADGSNSSGDHLVATTAFAPTVSAAWDATHDGRTVVRASYNQYVDLDVGSLARHTISGPTQRKCQWNDATSAFDRNCEYSGGATKNTFGLPCGPAGVDAQGNPCRENLKIPRVYEYTLGGEREVAQGIALSLDLIYRDFTNQYETRETNRIWNNTGETLSLTGAYRNGRKETIMDLGTPDGAKREYKGVTLGLSKREGRLKVHGSYTLSSLIGNVFDGMNNPWGDIPPRDIYLYGELADDHRHEVKIGTTYQATSWLSAGLRYRYFSGTPYNRLFRDDVTSAYDLYRARVGINPGTNLNDPGDDRPLRLPDMQDVNVQVRANLLPLTGQRLEFYVDVLNALGLRTTTSVGQNDGADFGLVRDRMDPFRIRVGMNYRY